MSAEYCCTIVRIGEITPIENTDFLATTELNGRTIVIRKDQVKQGDVMFYASNQSALNADFLRANSLFEEKTLNADPEKKGYFNKYGCVRMVKLRGILSMGYIFSLDELKNYNSEIDITAEELEALVDTDFDEVCGKLFVKAFVPPMPNNGHGSTGQRGVRKGKLFDRMVNGQITRHYDTAQLERNMHRVQPTDTVAITVKLHGTSIYIGNVIVKKPLLGGVYARNFNRLPKWLQFTRKGYDVVFASRKNVLNGSIGCDIENVLCEYREPYKLIKDYIPRNTTIYGEVIGYKPNMQKMVQKGWDYGYPCGYWALMIYRVKYHDKHVVKEYDVEEVRKFTLDLYDALERAYGSDVASHIRPMDLLYHGTLQDLYPDIPVDDNWHSAVLARLKTEKRFGMEQNEPLCKNKVPREGIVLRIDNDVIPEAFKLKCLKFYSKETDMIDKGEIEDSEMYERYGDEEN